MHVEIDARSKASQIVVENRSLHHPNDELSLQQQQAPLPFLSLKIKRTKDLDSSGSLLFLNSHITKFVVHTVEAPLHHVLSYRYVPPYAQLYLNGFLRFKSCPVCGLQLTQRSIII